MARAIPLTWFLIGGAGILYLLYAKKTGLPPFNSGGLAEKYLPDFVHPQPIGRGGGGGGGGGSGSGPGRGGGPDFPVGPGGGGVSLPPPLDPARMSPQQMMAGRDIYGNPVKPGTNPFEAPMAPGMIDLGSGYQMANPNGVPNSFGSGAGRGTQFQSTVANDPTPVNYGIYTQYLNGLRNEYQQMDEQRRVANAQDIGIGGDITTLPQPAVVGATPFNYPTPNMQQRPPSYGPPQLNVGGMQIPMGGNSQVSINGMPIGMGMPQMYNPATAAGAQPYPQYGAPSYAQGPILQAPRSPYFGSYYASPMSTSIMYDEQEMRKASGPVDITGIKPTLFNMVSRNQPGGLKGQKIGNVR